MPKPTFTDPFRLWSEEYRWVHDAPPDEEAIETFKAFRAGGVTNFRKLKEARAEWDKNRARFHSLSVEGRQFIKQRLDEIKVHLQVWRNDFLHPKAIHAVKALMGVNMLMQSLGVTYKRGRRPATFCDYPGNYTLKIIEVWEFRPRPAARITMGIAEQAGYNVVLPGMDRDKGVKSIEDMMRRINKSLKHT